MAEAPLKEQTTKDNAAPAAPAVPNYDKPVAVPTDQLHGCSLTQEVARQIEIEGPTFPEIRYANRHRHRVMGFITGWFV